MDEDLKDEFKEVVKRVLNGAGVPVHTVDIESVVEDDVELTCVNMWMGQEPRMMVANINFKPELLKDNSQFEAMAMLLVETTKRSWNDREAIFAEVAKEKD